MPDKSCTTTVGVFESRAAAERAVADLKAAAIATIRSD